MKKLAMVMSLLFFCTVLFAQEYQQDRYIPNPNPPLCKEDRIYAVFLNDVDDVNPFSINIYLDDVRVRHHAVHPNLPTKNMSLLVLKSASDLKSHYKLTIQYSSGESIDYDIYNIHLINGDGFIYIDMQTKEVTWITSLI